MTLRASSLLLVMFVASCGLAVSGATTETDAGGPDVGAPDGATPLEDGGSTSGGIVEPPDAGDDASPADASRADASRVDAGGGSIRLLGNSTGQSSSATSVQVTLPLSSGDSFLGAALLRRGWTRARSIT